MGWSHFDFTSSCNPYIAFTEERRDEILKYWQERGVKVDCYISEHGMPFYTVHDKEYYNHERI